VKTAKGNAIKTGASASLANQEYCGGIGHEYHGIESLVYRFKVSDMRRLL
jgi:hypothetical protein